MAHCKYQLSTTSFLKGSCFPPICSSNAWLRVGYSWGMITQPGACLVLIALCLFSAKLEQRKRSDSLISDEKTKGLNWKQRQNHGPWSPVTNVSMPNHTVQGPSCLTLFRGIFLTVAPCMSIACLSILVLVIFQHEIFKLLLYYSNSES